MNLVQTQSAGGPVTHLIAQWGLYWISWQQAKTHEVIMTKKNINNDLDSYWMLAFDPVFIYSPFFAVCEVVF